MKRILEESLKGGRRLRFIVKGNSMSPFIKDGESVEVERAERIRIGDVVLLRRKKEFLLHRVIFLSKNFVITKGDKSPFIDPPFERKDIIGRVRREEGIMKIFRTFLSFLFITLSLPKVCFKMK